MGNVVRTEVQDLLMDVATYVSGNIECVNVEYYFDGTVYSPAAYLLHIAGVATDEDLLNEKNFFNTGTPEEWTQGMIEKGITPLAMQKLQSMAWDKKPYEEVLEFLGFLFDGGSPSEYTKYQFGWEEDMHRQAEKMAKDSSQ